MKLTGYKKGETYFLVTGRNLEDNEVPALEAFFLKAIKTGCGQVLVDCRKLQKFSIAAMRLVLAYLGRLQTEKVSLAFYGVSQPVMKLLNTSGLDGLLLLAETEEAAEELIKNQLTIK